MKEYNGRCPKNSRIKIDYTGVKPRVRFSYPAKKEQMQGSMFFWIFIGYCLLCLPAFAINSLLEENYNPEADDMKNKSEYDLSNYSDFNRYFKDNEELLINRTYTLLYKQTFCDWDLRCTYNYFANLSTYSKINLALLFSMLIIPSLIYFPFRKKWQGIYPDWMAFLARKKYKKFKPDEVKKDYDGKWFCEIPLFSNVLLDYEAKGDFSRYLEFFEIREHSFRYWRGRRKRNKIRRKKNKPRHEVNEWLWYAKFYFKEKPRTGSLEVLFK